MTKEELITNLQSKKSSDRKKAAKEIAKSKLIELGEVLFRSYLTEKQDSRTWETQTEMLLALGAIDYKTTLKEVEAIVKLNNPHDMITYAAAQTFVRLSRESLNDATPVIKLLKFGGLSVVDGCLNPLGYDKMTPPEQEIKELLSLSWDLHKHKDRLGFERNYSDPRYGIAAACAGWSKELTKDFLEYCLQTGDTPVRYVADNSLKGKYVKLR